MKIILLLLFLQVPTSDTTQVSSGATQRVEVAQQEDVKSDINDTLDAIIKNLEEK